MCGGGNKTHNFFFFSRNEKQQLLRRQKYRYTGNTLFLRVACWGCGVDRNPATLICRYPSVYILYDSAMTQYHNTCRTGIYLQGSTSRIAQLPEAGQMLRTARPTILFSSEHICISGWSLQVQLEFHLPVTALLHSYI